jgi:hypothetical protein
LKFEENLGTFALPGSIQLLYLRYWKNNVVEKTSYAWFGQEVNCFVAKSDGTNDYEDYGYNVAQNLKFGKRNSLKSG